MIINTLSNPRFLQLQTPNGIVHLQPFIKKKHVRIINLAHSILKRRVKWMKSCNDCFKKLPKGRSFAEVLNDNKIWVHFDANANYGWESSWYPKTKDISISEDCLKKGHWWTAGMLVHELAHINGAPKDTLDADKTLKRCGLGGAYTGRKEHIVKIPNITGRTP